VVFFFMLFGLYDLGRYGITAHSLDTLASMSARQVIKAGGWRSSMADGHREAAPSVLEGHPPPCDAGDRRALGRASASLDPYMLREAELGSPSKMGPRLHRLP
jgi:hypothetical protein